MLLSRFQIAAARSLIGWTRSKLAQKSGLSPVTVADIERGVVNSKAITIEKIVRAIEAEGIEFIWGNSDGVGEGVRRTRKTK